MWLQWVTYSNRQKVGLVWGMAGFWGHTAHLDTHWVPVFAALSRREPKVSTDTDGAHRTLKMVCSTFRRLESRSHRMRTLENLATFSNDLGLPIFQNLNLGKAGYLHTWSSPSLQLSPCQFQSHVTPSTSWWTLTSTSTSSSCPSLVAYGQISFDCPHPLNILLAFPLSGYSFYGLTLMPSQEHKGRVPNPGTLEW